MLDRSSILLITIGLPIHVTKISAINFNKGVFRLCPMLIDYLGRSKSDIALLWNPKTLSWSWLMSSNNELK